MQPRPSSFAYFVHIVAFFVLSGFWLRPCCRPHPPPPARKRNPCACYVTLSRRTHLGDPLPRPVISASPGLDATLYSGTLPGSAQRGYCMPLLSTSRTLRPSHRPAPLPPISFGQTRQSLDDASISFLLAPRLFFHLPLFPSQRPLWWRWRRCRQRTTRRRRRHGSSLLTNFIILLASIRPLL